MNSKKKIVLLFLFILSGCGVKADPAKYSDTVIDSYIQSYTGSDPTPEEIERIKRNEDANEITKKLESETKTPSLIPTP